jgi:hypothetical protein
MFRRHHDKIARRFRASAEPGFVDMRWRAAHAGDARFRIQRSEQREAETVDPTGADVLWEGSDTTYQDRKAVGRRHYIYLLYACLPGGDWCEQARARVHAKLPEPQRDRSTYEANKIATGAYDKVSNR